MIESRGLPSFFQMNGHWSLMDCIRIFLSCPFFLLFLAPLLQLFGRKFSRGYKIIRGWKRKMDIHIFKFYSARTHPGYTKGCAVVSVNEGVKNIRLIGIEIRHLQKWVIRYRMVIWEKDIQTEEKTRGWEVWEKNRQNRRTDGPGKKSPACIIRN